MNDIDTAAAYVAKIEAIGGIATVDPRSAVPPCVLIGHTGAAVSSSCAELVDFYAALLLPGTWNADAWTLGARLCPTVWATVPAARRVYVLYRLALDSPPIPAYLFTWQEDCDIGEVIVWPSFNPEYATAS